MNLLHFSNADIRGGAAQATYQLHTLLRNAGHKSVMAVRRKDSADSDVVRVGALSLMDCTWAERLERGRARLAGGYRVKPLPFHYFNLNLAPAPDLRSALDAMPRPDVIFLHWITGLLTAADIRRIWERLRCPLVWVVLDMEPMTGGCHYPEDCTRFHSNCGQCPQLTHSGPHDWTWRIWHEKHRQIADLPITFVAATQWIANRLSESGLFGKHRVTRIPLPMNALMHPMEKNIARNILGLPIDKRIILVGGHDLKDPRKGMDRFLAAARILAEQGKLNGDLPFRKDNLLFLLLGENGMELAANLPFPTRDMGYIHSQIELTLAYQAADVFASPSMEDAGPMMVSQAMLCSTPVVAFDTGIAPELIVSGKTGYLARLGDAEDFACGLKAMLADDGSAGPRAAAVASRHHDPQVIARAYDAILADLVRRPSGPIAS
jgi:glycosyltransferase involved in cell wall biosynthesis